MRDVVEEVDLHQRASWRMSVTGRDVPAGVYVSWVWRWLERVIVLDVKDCVGLLSQDLRTMSQRASPWLEPTEEGTP